MGGGYHYPRNGVNALGVACPLFLIVRELPFLHALILLLLPHPLLFPVGVAVQQEAKCPPQLVPRQTHNARHQPWEHVCREPLGRHTHSQVVHINRTA